MRGRCVLTELSGASDSLALPERSDAGHAGSRRDEDAVARDLLDAPGRRSEHERLALARLVHHLLVELAHAPAPVDEEDTEEAAVRDRPGVGDREAPSAGAPAHRAGSPIPHDPRPELRELVGRVAAREHVEDVLELRTRQLRERIRAPRELVELVHRDLLVGADRDDLLGEHVQRIAGDPRLLDLPRAHGARDDRGLQEVGAELREDPPLRDRVQIVARAPDSLQPTRDRLRALHLDHEVDGAHVDAELERGRRHEARDLARLEQLLDDEPLLASERAVVRPGELFAGELVDAKREPLREAPVVHEDDRRAVLPDELEDRGVDRGPDRPARALDANAHLDPVCERRHRERAPSTAALACPRPGRRPGCPAPCGRPRRRAGSLGPIRRRSDRSPPSVAGSPRAQGAGKGRRRGARVARARAPGARRASCRRLRAPRRGSRSRSRAASRVPAR